MTDLAITHAPWTDREVEALNAYQDHSLVHPFTCANRDSHPGCEARGEPRRNFCLYCFSDTPISCSMILDDVLLATNEGWVCDYCDYKQDWAYQEMIVIGTQK